MKGTNTFFSCFGCFFHFDDESDTFGFRVACIHVVHDVSILFATTTQLVVCSCVSFFNFDDATYFYVFSLPCVRFFRFRPRSWIN